jgi:hypothetical protein
MDGKQVCKACGPSKAEVLKILKPRNYLGFDEAY